MVKPLLSWFWRPAICCLLVPCGPIAIIFRIAKIILSTLECQTRRRVSHVLVEVSKVEPLLAHRNAAPTIIGIGSMFLIAAAREHREPHRINWSPIHAVFRFRRRIASGCSLPSKAPARKRCPRHQGGPARGDRAPAIAKAPPTGLGIWGWLPRHDRQSAVFLSRRDFYGRHEGYILTSTLNIISTGR